MLELCFTFSREIKYGSNQKCQPQVSYNKKTFHYWNSLGKNIKEEDVISFKLDGLFYQYIICNEANTYINQIVRYVAGEK